MAKHFMLDTETLSTRKDGVQLSIALLPFNPMGSLSDLVSFNPEGVASVKEGYFYRKIDVQSCLDVGLKIDGSTLNWWMGESSIASKEAFSGGDHINVVMAGMLMWMRDQVGEDDQVKVWANGPSFDIANLEHVASIIGFAVPWKYNSPRCCRTIFDLASSTGSFIEPFAGDGLNGFVQHNALWDCVYQAAKVQNSYRALGIKI